VLCAARFILLSSVNQPNEKSEIISEEKVISKIYLIRDRKVMLDRDLAEMYGVETRVLNQSVKRNLKDFLKILCFSLQKKSQKT
jgi:hypothetical protein